MKIHCQQSRNNNKMRKKIIVPYVATNWRCAYSESCKLNWLTNESIIYISDTQPHNEEEKEDFAQSNDCCMEAHPLFGTLSHQE